MGWMPETTRMFTSSFSFRRLRLEEGLQVGEARKRPVTKQAIAIDARAAADQRQQSGAAR